MHISNGRQRHQLIYLFLKRMQTYHLRMFYFDLLYLSTLTDMLLDVTHFARENLIKMNDELEHGRHTYTSEEQVDV